MRCDLCGLEYGLSHNCAGISPLVLPGELAAPPGLRFAPFYYLEESFKILTWNDVAVRRAAKDNNSLVYGFSILALGTAVPFEFLLLRNWGLGYEAPWKLAGLRFGQTLATVLVWIILQIGLSHVLAKIFFDAEGSYIELMRAYMLGQMFRWLAVIPVVGGLLAGLGGIATLMIVFEEVDKVERMKAFMLAAAIGIIFWIGTIWVTTNGPRPIH